MSEAESKWLPGALTVVGNKHVADGTQVWTKGQEVLGITTNERARFFAMFGLMQVPYPRADTVMISAADYEALKAHNPPPPNGDVRG